MDCSASVPMFHGPPWVLFQHDNGQNNVKGCVPSLPEQYLLNGQAQSRWFLNSHIWMVKNTPYTTSLQL